jgi:hypothetical protein
MAGRTVWTAQRFTPGGCAGADLTGRRAALGRPTRRQPGCGSTPPQAALVSRRACVFRLAVVTSV